jgi:hypothetical protein
MGDWEAREFSGTRLESRKPTTYRWLPRACVCSWLLLATSLIVLVTGAVTLEELRAARARVCAEPEIAGGLADGATCQAALSCFAHCVDDTSLITTARMRGCFLAADDTEPPAGDSQCTYDSATLAYGLAQRYIQPNVSATRARELMSTDLGRRLQRAPAGTASPAAEAGTGAGGAGGAGGAAPSIRRYDLALALLRARLTGEPHDAAESGAPPPWAARLTTLGEQLRARADSAAAAAAGGRRLRSDVSLINSGQFWQQK